MATDFADDSSSSHESDVAMGVPLRRSFENSQVRHLVGSKLKERAAQCILCVSATVPIALASVWIRLLRDPPAAANEYGGWLTYLLPYTVGLCVMIVAASALFPAELSSRAASEFLLVPAIANASCDALATCIDLRSTVAAINKSCRRVVVSMLLGCLAVSGLRCFAVVSGRLTWRAFRGLLMIDGLIVFSGELLLRRFGPPPAYPPFNVLFEVGLARCARRAVGTSLFQCSSPAHTVISPVSDQPRQRPSPKPWPR